MGIGVGAGVGVRVRGRVRARAPPPRLAYGEWRVVGLLELADGECAEELLVRDRDRDRDRASIFRDRARARAKARDRVRARARASIVRVRVLLRTCSEGCENCTVSGSRRSTESSGMRSASSSVTWLGLGLG